MIEKIFERLSAEIKDTWNVSYKNGLAKAVEIVQEVAKDGGWIPCERELPPMPKENPLFENKPLELYLTTIKGADYPFIAFWNGKFFTDGWGKVEAIAWMPLPPVYQKGE